MSDLQKLLPRLVAVTASLASAFLIVHPFSWSGPLQTSLLLFLNITIILAAAYFGAAAVATFGAFSLLVSFAHSSQFTILPSLLLLATVAIFYIYCLRENLFTQRVNVELENIEEEKNVLAVELEHLRLENSSLRRKLHRYSALKSLSETLSSAFSLDEIVSRLGEEALRIVGKGGVCLLYLVDEQEQQLSLAGTKGAGSEYEVKFKQGDMFDDWVFRQRSRLMVTDIKKDYRFNIQDIADKEARAFGSLISAPLMRENKFLGILRLDNELAGVYDADDLRVLDIISDLAALAVENALLYQQAGKLAITDGLSGLFVHRYFQERLEQEISRAVWTNSQFALLMLDIDDFKGYNDKHGHIAGDILLRQIAQLLRSTVSPGDIVARYGGEEFAVLLVDIPKQQAGKVAEQIREKIEKKNFLLRRQATKATLSGGLSFFPEDNGTKENLIKRADQALYKAKVEGKNRICTL